MIATQSISLYNRSLRYFKNEADATAFVKELEVIMNNKLNRKKSILSTKDDLVSVRKENA